jgi:hypothetical protein
MKLGPAHDMPSYVRDAGTVALPKEAAGQHIAYEICVRGQLSDALAARLGGRRLDLGHGKTALVVEVVDQSQLHGVIERLRDLNIVIERLNPV